jgi:hypothetical protein
MAWLEISRFTTAAVISLVILAISRRTFYSAPAISFYFLISQIAHDDAVTLGAAALTIRFDDRERNRGQSSARLPNVSWQENVAAYILIGVLQLETLRFCCSIA